MSEGSGKLAETLASSIVDRMNELAKSGRVEGDWIKSSDNMFSTMLDALQAVAENSYNARMLSDSTDTTLNTKQIEDRERFKELNDFIKNEVVERLKRIEAERKKETEEKKKETESENPDLNEMSTEVTEGEGVRGRNPLQRSISRLEIGQNKLMQAVEALKKDNKNIRTDIEDNEKRTRKRSIKMERSIKHTIKTRMGKLWSLFKKTLVIGLLLFFTPVLKKAFNKLGDLLSPVVDWFKTNFPKLYDYIKDLSAYIGSLASDFKWLIDRIKVITNWIDEHQVAVAAGEGAVSGAMAGAAIGSVIPGVGTAVGAAIGAGVGAIGGGVIGKKISDNEKKSAIEDAERQKMFADFAVQREIEKGNISKDDTVAIEEATARKLEEIKEEEKNVHVTELDMSVRKKGESFGEMFKRVWREAFEDTRKPKTETTSAPVSNSSETSADVLESALDGKTTVEPSDEDTGGNSVAYSVSQNSTFNNYFVPPTENLWNTP